jgi:ribulose 1,5-bisphosphate synthetase/thiazole synthase
MSTTMSTTTISEAARTVPVLAEVDVLVAGGGLGGVSAAMAAARAGAKTLLIERNGFVGGVATAGLCCSIFNCYYTHDHRLGVTGNAVTVADALAEAAGFGRKWHKHKGHIIYDVEQAKLILASLIHDAGADILYDTVVSGAIMDGTTLRGLVVESKSGRQAILAKVVVDATGDSDVAARAGAPLFEKAASPKHSFCFRLGRVDLDRFVQYLIDHPGAYPEFMDVDWTFEEALTQYRDTGTLLYPHGGAMQMDVFKQARANGTFPEKIGMHDTLDACQMHGSRERGFMHIVTGFVYFDDLDIRKISQSMDDGRRMAFTVTDFFTKNVPGFEQAYVIATADDLGIRVSRWLDGDVVFTRAMKENPTVCADAIGRGVVQRDVRKHKGERAWGVQTFPDDFFHIPYGCLVPRHVDGLLMGAGRSVSSENAWLLRVMGLTMVVGQGAGVAAAVSAKAGVAPRSVDVAAVQDQLKRQGVDLG